MKTLTNILLSVFALAVLLPAVPARHHNRAIAQHEVAIPLSQRGTINLYSVREKSHNTFEFVAMNVEHPIKKKPVTGEVELQFKCGDIPYVKQLFMRSGSSRAEKVECLIIISPTIIIRNEGEED